MVGGPVFAILMGMIIRLFHHGWHANQEGIKFTSKKILQLAVVFLGFGLNLKQIGKVGMTSLPIIISTIATALIVAYIVHRIFKMDEKLSILVGVGSSICGGSAIAATAPVIKAKDHQIAQAISVIFFFNVVAALVFPSLGELLGLSNDGFGLFAGTAVNDTSSVTATAAAWDGAHPGANTLDMATIVKLTRTLAIIPITLVLGLYEARREKKLGHSEGKSNKGKVFPMFILYFLLASLITTVAPMVGIPVATFKIFKTISKFMIVMAMAAIGLNTDIKHLIKTGGTSLIMGFSCWVAISVVSLSLQKFIGIW